MPLRLAAHQNWHTFYDEEERVKTDIDWLPTRAERRAQSGGRAERRAESGEHGEHREW